MSAVAFACAAKSSGGGYRRSSRNIVSMACFDVSVATRYPSVLRGIGEPTRALVGMRPQNGDPTGSVGVVAMPLTTPAADAYQAAAAVTMPTQPPVCSQPLFALPFASSQKPITT